MSLRGRLSLGYALCFMLGLVVLAIGLYSFLARSLLSDVDQELRASAEQLERSAAARSGGRLDVAGLNADIFTAGPQSPRQEFASPGVYVRVMNAQGNVLVMSSASVSQIPIDLARVAEAAGGHPNFETVSVQNSNVRVLYWPFRTGGEVAAVVQIGESLRPMERTLERTQLILIVGGACIVIAGVAGGWLIARQTLLPVRTLTDSVGEIARTREFSRRVPQPDTNDEIGRLAATFNELLDRLGTLVTRQRALVADTSHELRNPLMVVRGNLELIAHEQLPASERADAVADSLEEVDRMTQLISDLLFLADADTRDSIQRAEVSLDELVASIAEDAKLIAVREDGEREVVLEANDPLVVLGDPLRLRQLVWNLTENAVRYTPAGGTVTLALRRHGAVAELSVSDTGIGIPDEHLPHIFERFYRVDRGRSRALGGTGLGLSIVRQVAESHGGRVRVRSRLGEGSTFTVVLPIVEETDLDQ